ncbi:MAG: hypothetical protein VX715_03195 [Planctomycetota bacterium]|nr:hypothetical protein [Planctomycetota bacterium]
MDVETAAIQMRQALDPADARVFIDRATNRIVIKGNTGAHRLAAEMLKTIDRPSVSSPSIPIPRIRTVRQLRCYLLAPNDVRLWTEELTRRYSKNTGVRITPDVKNGQITVVAPVAIHEQLGVLLAGQLPASSEDDWQSRQEQQAIASSEEATAPDNVVPATRVEEADPEASSESNNWLARIARLRPGAFSVTPPAKEGKLEAIDEAPADLQVVTVAETPLPEATPEAPRQVAPVAPAINTRKIMSAFPQSQKARTRPAVSASSARAGETEKGGDNLVDSLKKDLTGGVKSIDEEFRSLHHKITRPVTGFFESVQEDLSISVTDLARTVSGRLSAQEKDQDSRPRAARVIRGGQHPVTTPPSTPRTRPKPVTKPVEEKPVEVREKKPVVKPVDNRAPFNVVPEQPITRPAPLLPAKAVSGRSPVVVPLAPPLPATRTKQPGEVREPLKTPEPKGTRKEFTPARPLVLEQSRPRVQPATVQKPQVSRQPATAEKNTPVTPASTLAQADPVSEPVAQPRQPVSPRVNAPPPVRIPEPSRVALPALKGTAAAGISLVGASDLEISQFVARHLRLQEAGDLAGSEIRMMIKDRQVWFVIQQENGTMVRVRVGEIKLDREGKGVLVVDPEKLPR